jgi:hypothetical protein
MLSQIFEFGAGSSFIQEADGNKWDVSTDHLVLKALRVIAPVFRLVGPARWGLTAFLGLCV